MSGTHLAQMQRVKERMDTLSRLYEELQSGGIVGVVIQIGADAVLVRENMAFLLSAAKTGLILEAQRIVADAEADYAETRAMCNELASD